MKFKNKKLYVSITLLFAMFIQIFAMNINTNASEFGVQSFRWDILNGKTVPAVLENGKYTVDFSSKFNDDIIKAIEDQYKPPAYTQAFITSLKTTPFKFITNGQVSGLTGYTAIPEGKYKLDNSILTIDPLPTGKYEIKVYAEDNVNPPLKEPYSFGYFVVTVDVAPTMTISPDTLPNGTVKTEYTQTISATGGTGNITFTTDNSKLPTGLTLDSNGKLSGEPSKDGTYTFTVTAKDGAGATATKEYTVTIGNPPALTITTNSLSSGTFGIGYSQTISATGGTGNITFTTDNSKLPAGLTLGSDGKVTGIPTAAGTYTFTVTATDGAGATATKSYTVIIASSSGNGNGTIIISTPTTTTTTISDPFVYVGGNNTTSGSGSGSGTNTTSKNTTSKNAVITASNKTLNIGDQFDILKGVTAKDNAGKGKDITNKITTSGNINTSVAGKYNITYKVVGSNGKTVTKTITVTIGNSTKVVGPTKCTPDVPGSACSTN